MTWYTQWKNSRKEKSERFMPNNKLYTMVEPTLYKMQIEEEKQPNQ